MSLLGLLVTAAIVFVLGAILAIDALDLWGTNEDNDVAPGFLLLLLLAALITYAQN